MKQLWSEKIFEEGLQKGLQEGLHEGQQRMLEMQLTQRFGPLSPLVIERIAGLHDTAELERLVLLVLPAPSLEAMGLGEAAQK